MLPNNTIVLPRIDSNYVNADEYMAAKEIMDKVLDGGYNEANFLGFLEVTDRAVVSKNSTFHHYERGSLYRDVKVASVVGTPTASSAVITLTADSYTAAASITGNINRSPLKANDIVKLPGNYEAFVQIKSSPTPTSGLGFVGSGLDNGAQTGTATRYTLVRGAGATYDLGVLVAAMVSSEQPLVAFTNGFAEGSFPPIEGTDVLNTRFSGHMQIFKTSTPVITGDAASDEMIIPWGESGDRKYASKLRAEALLKHKLDMGFSNLLQRGYTYTDAEGRPVKTQRGLEGYISDMGINYPFTGTFDKADLDALIAELKADTSSRQYICPMGSGLYAAMEDILTPLVNGNIDYSAFGKGDAKKRAIDLGFTSFTYRNITFHLIEEPAFNHPKVTALEGQGYANMGFFIPAESQKITIMDDSTMSQFTRYIPSIQLRYKLDPEGSRQFRDWSSNYKNNGGQDVFGYHIQSQHGLQMANLHKFAKVYKSA